MTVQDQPHSGSLERTNERCFPWGALLILAAAGFITILTEALPAGLLPQMGADLGISHALVGQLVTVYALGSLIAAIPLIAVTRSMRRLPLLCAAIGGFSVVNLITALSHDYTLTLVARFFAGVFAGLLWALVAGYASRMVPARLQGRAIAVAMVGTPLALSIGIPAGTALGTALGWRITFGIMTLLTVILVLCAWFKIPDFSGDADNKRRPVLKVFTLAGIPPVLCVTFVFVLAHNILYTYIAPLLEPAGLSARVDLILLVFGLAALPGIWLVGLLIDRWLRELVLVSIAMFAMSSLMLCFFSDHPLVWFAAIILWGLSFGGAPALLQTALARAAGKDADIAQSIFVTMWNLGIAGGGLAGGMLLETLGVPAFAWIVLLLLAMTFVVAVSARRSGFA